MNSLLFVETSKGQTELLNDPLNELLDDTQSKILIIKSNDRSPPPPATSGLYSGTGKTTAV